MKWRLRGDSRIDRMIKEQTADSGGVWWSTGSGRVVLFAVGLNFIDMSFKCIGAYITGSKSLFAEAIHSGLDTANQVKCTVRLLHRIEHFRFVLHLVSNIPCYNRMVVIHTAIVRFYNLIDSNTFIFFQVIFVK